jgi:hypothetical protein
MALVERAIAWLLDQRQSGGREAHHLRRLARAFYESERFDDAKAVLSGIAAESSEDLDTMALGAAISARRGDEAAARSAAVAMQTMKGRFRFGAQFVCSARVLAVLGDVEPAIAALRGAFARGYCYGIELHTDVDLALLGAHPSYGELLRPKG